MQLLEQIGRLLVVPGSGASSEVGAVEDGCLVWEDSTLRFAGRRRDLPRELEAAVTEVASAGGRLVVPGLVDCHTHLCHAGTRFDEFEWRLEGRSYLEIAAEGGGIQRTVRATREASDETLEALCLARLDEMARFGVTTVECKSGYGLSLEHELRTLQLYQKLNTMHAIELVPTFLGAHVVGPEFSGNAEGYIELLIEEMLPAVADAHLARFCDIFVEEGAFTPGVARRFLARAAEYGLRAKLHVDQLSDLDGGRLAADVAAISADHLEYVSEAGVEAMTTADVVAVNLPYASFFLGQPAMPARAFLDAGATLAIATDFNPGSAPSFDLPLAMGLACSYQKLTAAEALRAATWGAARAIGEESRRGSLEVGKRADFAIVDCAHERDWLYPLRSGIETEAYAGGRLVTPGEASA